MLHIGLMLQNDLRSGPLSERLDAGALLADDGTTDFVPEHHRDGKPCRLRVALRHVSLAQLVVQEHLGIGHLVEGAHDDDPPGLQVLGAAGHAHLATGLCCRVLDLAAASAQHCSGHAVGDHQMQAHLVCAGWAPAEIVRAKQPLRWTAWSWRRRLHRHRQCVDVDHHRRLRRPHDAGEGGSPAGDQSALAEPQHDGQGLGQALRRPLQRHWPLLDPRDRVEVLLPSDLRDNADVPSLLQVLSSLANGSAGPFRRYA
mmetsp:Transcript_91403/g.261676  ORF Transcript_91403/g.261676 Transcript_91403/m.261676 type:complete len:257 (-) Transcript_91403:237-1007(-)